MALYRPTAREMETVETNGIGILRELKPTTRTFDPVPAKELFYSDRLVLEAPAKYGPNKGQMVRLKTYSIGSVLGYAMEYGECPIAALDQARARGEKLWWINGLGASITAEPRQPKAHIIVRIGDRVRFEGRVFTIVAAPNDNLGLLEIGLVGETPDDIEIKQSGGALA